MISPLSVCQYVSVSGEKTDSWIFEKKSHFEDNAKKKKKFFLDFVKKKTPLICRFFGFKSCITVTFIILVKVHVWEKSGSGVKCKNAPGQTDWLLGPIMLCLYSRGPFLDFENDLDRNFNHYANMSMNFFFFF